MVILSIVPEIVVGPRRCELGAGIKRPGVRINSQVVADEEYVEAPLVKRFANIARWGNESAIIDVGAEGQLYPVNGHSETL